MMNGGQSLESVARMMICRAADSARNCLPVSLVIVNGYIMDVGEPDRLTLRISQCDDCYDRHPSSEAFCDMYNHKIPVHIRRDWGRSNINPCHCNQCRKYTIGLYGPRHYQVDHDAVLSGECWPAKRRHDKKS